MSKINALVEQTKREILDGHFGNSGEKFPTIRDFSKSRKIAYVTAVKLYNILKEDFFIIIRGNNHYILKGLCKKTSPLYKIVASTSPRKRVGLHIKDLSNQFFTILSQEIHKYLTEAGVELLILTSNNDPKQEINCLIQFLDFGCCGVLDFAGFRDKKLFDLYARYPLPHILIGRTLGNIETDFITTDNYESGKQAAKYLYECGYQEFAYLGLKTLTDSVDLRFEGFKNELADLGYKIKPALTFHINIDDSIGHIIGSINKHNFPLGIFCYHDLLAVKLLNHLSYNKINIPNSVGIIGYDDLPISSAVNPSLTTFSYNYSAYAKLTVEILFKKIQTHDTVHKNHIFRTNLIIRKSTTNFSLT